MRPNRRRIICSICVLIAGAAQSFADGPPQAPQPTDLRLNSAGARGILYTPSGKGPFPALLVVHGDHGLTDWTRQQAGKLAERGFVVLAIDLYRGEQVDAELDAHIMERGLPEDRALADLKLGIDHLAGRPEVRAESIGVIGWDSGAGHALEAAISDKRIKASVVCYGRLVTDPARLEPLQASVLGIFAGKDAGISPETIQQFRAAMHKAGKRVAGVHTYPSAGHGFMERADATTADAWSKINGYLDAELAARPSRVP